ncbi:MAG: hypothetical protein JKY49_09230 [Cohaesibacteraceae bacterium]|nr:hypothetical protein [Cohaesibacteraceae bacterium]
MQMLHTYQRRILLLLLYSVLVAGSWYFAPWFMELVTGEYQPEHDPLLHAMIITTLVIYVCASAIPFVPGAEIGLALLIIFGGKISLLVYGCMVTALLLAWSAGRFIAPQRLAGILNFLGLKKSRDLVLELIPLDDAERKNFMVTKAPHKIVPLLFRYRHAVLILLFNLPGNVLLGGGGGIAFTAGMCRLFSFPAFFASVLIAIIPVPLFFWLATG